MALPGSGTLALSDIQTEFGGSNPISISEYYGSGGAPGSGTISISDFYGLSAGPAVPPFASIYVADGRTTAGNLSLNSAGSTGTYLIIVYVGDNGLPSTPSGFTLLTSVTTSSCDLAVYYKIRSGSEGTVLVNSLAGSAACLFDCNNIYEQPTSSGTTGMPDPTTATIATSRYSFIAGGLDDDGTVTPTAPSGYTLIDYTNVNGGASASVTLMTAYNPSTGGGSTNPAAFGGGGSDNWAAVHLEVD